MKFKHLLLTASVMALFSSCSNDELVSESTSHGDAIAFSVTTTNATRAADYWCNNNLPQFFEVSATYFDGTSTATYFDGDMYKKDTGITYTPNDGNYRYWPDLTNAEGTEAAKQKSLNVWAYKVKAETKNVDDTYTSGAGFATFNWNNGAPTIDMTPAPAAADQHDLLYAYTQVKTKPGYGETAPINFRHALSQIVFYARCSNSKIQVDIEEVALYNAAKSGTFTLPTGADVTNDNLKDHTQAGTAKDTGLGTWALEYGATAENKAYRAYTASCVKTLTPGAGVDAWTNLTDQVNAEGTYTENEYGQSLLVLPQTDYTKGGTVTDVVNNNVAAYVPANGSLKTQGGACIAIKCKIRNIAGTEVKDNDVYLWGSASAAEYLVVPVNFAWEQGKKYIYRINFSKKGHGGYDPGTGDEVLVPIQLDVTVDDFAKGTEYNGNW